MLTTVLLSSVLSSQNTQGDTGGVCVMMEQWWEIPWESLQPNNEACDDRLLEEQSKNGLTDCERLWICK
jgi:hypothetical protein